MQFIQIQDKDFWDKFISANSSSDILQTWEWGEVKRVENWSPYRFAVLETNGEIVLAGQILVKNVPFFGKLAYIPYGPCWQPGLSLEQLDDYWTRFETGILQWAETLGIFAIELEPKWNLEQYEEFAKVFRNWRKTGRNRQPKYKLIVDLTLSEEEILMAMHKSTRYNIKYAKKQGVIVNQYRFNDPLIYKKIDEFYELLLETQKRAKGYPIRSQEYFHHLVEKFSQSNYMKLFEVVFKGKTVAMNISQTTNYWSSSFYASSNRLFPHVKATYLLRWESMMDAKRAGAKIYDFWGIIPNSKQHAGYSANKLGFGGFREDFVGILMAPKNIKTSLWDIGLKFLAFFAEWKQWARGLF